MLNMLNMARHTSYTIWVCAAVEICKILLVWHNILYVFGSMQQCPTASGCPSSDCVAAIEQGSRSVDSSLSDKVMARCKTKLLNKTIINVYIHSRPLQRIYNKLQFIGQVETWTKKQTFLNHKNRTMLEVHGTAPPHSH